MSEVEKWAKNRPDADIAIIAGFCHTGRGATGIITMDYDDLAAIDVVREGIGRFDTPCESLSKRGEHHHFGAYDEDGDPVDLRHFTTLRPHGINVDIKHSRDGKGVVIMPQSVHVKDREVRYRWKPGSGPDAIRDLPPFPLKTFHNFLDKQADKPGLKDKPLAEGLTIMLAFGTGFPVGTYNAKDATKQGLVIGNNIWDFAPAAAFTYITQPILAEGTEFSAKLYYNNYLTNPATHYWTSPVVDIDFAVSEHIGQFQVGLAGFYAFQYEDDQLNGAPIKPDRREEVLALGGVLAYDMPEDNTYLKMKGLTRVIMRNTVEGWGVVFSWGKKF